MSCANPENSLAKILEVIRIPEITCQMMQRERERLALNSYQLNEFHEQKFIWTKAHIKRSEKFSKKCVERKIKWSSENLIEEKLFIW